MNGDRKKNGVWNHIIEVIDKMMECEINFSKQEKWRYEEKMGEEIHRAKGFLFLSVFGSVVIF